MAIGGFTSSVHFLRVRGKQKQTVFVMEFMNIFRMPDISVIFIANNFIIA